MSTSYSPIISKVYESRLILLEILKTRGFDIDDWGGFSVTEIQTLYNNKQLDMLLENPTDSGINYQQVIFDMQNQIQDINRRIDEHHNGNWN